MGFDRRGFDKDVGERLRLARSRARMTQSEVAEVMGITRAGYANVEAGRQRVPLDVAWRAAIIFGVSLTTLVPEPANRRQSPQLAIPNAGRIAGFSGSALPFALDTSTATAAVTVDLVVPKK